MLADSPPHKKFGLCFFSDEIACAVAAAREGPACACPPCIDVPCVDVPFVDVPCESPPCKDPPCFRPRCVALCDGFDILAVGCLILDCTFTCYVVLTTSGIENTVLVAVRKLRL
jgi:hypothetical protein